METTPSSEREQRLVVLLLLIFMATCAVGALALVLSGYASV